MDKAWWRPIFVGLRRHPILWLTAMGVLFTAGTILLQIGIAEANRDPAQPPFSQNLWFNLGVGSALAALLLGGMLIAAYFLGREGPTIARGVPGWDNKVVEITPGEAPHLQFYALLLKLCSPNGQRAEGAVQPLVTFHNVTYWAVGRWEEKNLEEGECPHYHTVYPNAFWRGPSDVFDGHYELRWQEKHGIGWRLLGNSYSFDVHQGRLVIPPGPLGKGICECPDAT